MRRWPDHKIGIPLAHGIRVDRKVRAEYHRVVLGRLPESLTRGKKIQQQKAAKGVTVL